MRNLNYVYNTQWIGVRAQSSTQYYFDRRVKLTIFSISTSSSRFNDMLTCIILISWLLILWIYFLWSRRRYYAAAWKLRGPVGWPFIGMGLQMMNPQSKLDSRKSCYLLYYILCDSSLQPFYSIWIICRISIRHPLFPGWVPIVFSMSTIHRA